MVQLTRRLGFQAIAGALLAPVLIRPSLAQVVMGDAYSVMAADERFTTWVRLIDAGGLQSYARSPTPYTVFAVTETGWAKFPRIASDLLAYQMETGSHNAQSAFPDTATIVKLVRSHVVAGKHGANEMMGKKTTVTTVAGTPLIVDATKQPVLITWDSVATGKSITATVPDMPIVALNAVIYPIDDIGLTA